MAQKVVTTVTDDIDGSDADESLEFSWEGLEYHIDLSEKNADKFRKVMAPYLTAAQRVGGRSRRGKAAATPRSASDAATVRAWASQNGYAVTDRGRISGEIRAAYEAANA
jgi:hypothetical protein